MNAKMIYTISICNASLATKGDALSDLLLMRLISFGTSFFAAKIATMPKTTANETAKLLHWGHLV